MKRIPLTPITAVILVIIFLFMSFSFQVRRTDVAVVTTFGKQSRTETKPGLYFRLPRPIQRVFKFENRLQTMDRKFETVLTSDERQIMATLFVGWKVGDPALFLQRFENGNKEAAEENLENLLRDAKNSVLGQHPLSELISANPGDLKFAEIEQEMLDRVKPLAESEYGIDVKLLGIKRLGLPESVTESVFKTMVEERNKLISALENEGEEQARKIRSNADRERDQIVAEAEKEARLIEGKADAVAASYYKVFEENPDLAILILRLNALEEMLRDRSTLILDQNTGPLNLLQGTSSNKE